MDKRSNCSLEEAEKLYEEVIPPNNTFADYLLSFLMD